MVLVGYQDQPSAEAYRCGWRRSPKSRANKHPVTFEPCIARELIAFRSVERAVLSNQQLV